MYRRAVITDEISQDLPVVLEVASAFALDGLEIRTIGGTRVDQLDRAAVGEIRAAVEAAGMRVCAVAPPFYKCDIDSPSERREHLEILRRTIDVAHAFGASLIRTFAFWRTRKLDDVWERVVASYDEPIEIAQRADVTLAVENEYACLIGTGRELARFLAAVDDERVKALWDPCNAFFAENAEAPFPNGYEAVRDRLVHVHLKDARRFADESTPRLTPLGEGSVDISGQLAALKRDRFEGYVSLETHWRPERLDDKTMRLPGGHPFSEKAAAATIYCLKKWDALIRETN